VRGGEDFEDIVLLAGKEIMIFSTDFFLTILALRVYYRRTVALQSRTIENSKKAGMNRSNWMTVVLTAGGKIFLHIVTSSKRSLRTVHERRNSYASIFNYELSALTCLGFLDIPKTHTSTNQPPNQPVVLNSPLFQS
jgi:hypothetical protein